MKTNILKRLSFILLFTIFISLILNYFVQFRIVTRQELTNSQRIFWQISSILAQNEEEAAAVEEDFRQMCLVRAKAAAYITHNHLNMLKTPEEMKKIAQLLQIDELHLFDTEGTIIAGSNPEYYGMNFYSGSQMQYFLPMLDDTTLEMCQDIRPNTAEGKLMQYAAVWCENKDHIVQIGMKPERVLKAKEKNELTYIFSMVTSEGAADIYAIDPESYTILASTKQTLTGQNAFDIGFPSDIASSEDRIRFLNINGEFSLCAFKETDSLILARIFPGYTEFYTLNRSTLLLALYIIGVTLIALYAIIRYLDHYIIKDIHRINTKLDEIEEGNLSITFPPLPTPELTELGTHINDMVTALTYQQMKLSLILNTVDLSIGNYEYNTETRHLVISPQAREILGFSSEENDVTPSLFRQKMDAILSAPVEGEKNIYRMPDDALSFVRVEYFTNDASILGIIMDVSDEMKEKLSIEQERDMDSLTGLPNRRAFYRQMDQLFRSPTEIGTAAMIMIDSDNLKYINDTYGHNNGDRYLKAIAKILTDIPAKKIVSHLSGDEFVVFIYQCASQTELQKSISYLMRQDDSMHLSIEESGVFVPVSFSVGCAYYPQEDTDYQALLKLADTRMYKHKKKRKESA